MIAKYRKHANKSQFSSEASVSRYVFFPPLVERASAIPITESTRAGVALNFAQCTLFPRGNSGNIVRRRGGRLDFTGDKVKANRRVGASNKKPGVSSATTRDNVWVAARHRAVYPALMQAGASLAKTDRPNRRRCYTRPVVSRENFVNSEWNRKPKCARACTRVYVYANARSLIKIGIKSEILLRKWCFLFDGALWRIDIENVK